MNTKYDWSDVPDNVQWIATDEDRNSWLFPFGSGKPFIGGEDGDAWVCDGEFTLEHHGYKVFKGRWQDSLEQRPCQ